MKKMLKNVKKMLKNVKKMLKMFFLKKKKV